MWKMSRDQPVLSKLQINSNLNPISDFCVRFLLGYIAVDCAALLAQWELEAINDLKPLPRTVLSPRNTIDPIVIGPWAWKISSNNTSKNSWIRVCTKNVSGWSWEFGHSPPFHKIPPKAVHNLLRCTEKSVLPTPDLQIWQRILDNNPERTEDSGSPPESKPLLPGSWPTPSQNFVKIRP